MVRQFFDFLGPEITHKSRRLFALIHVTVQIQIFLFGMRLKLHMQITYIMQLHTQIKGELIVPDKTF